MVPYPELPVVSGRALDDKEAPGSAVRASLEPKTLMLAGKPHATTLSAGIPIGIFPECAILPLIVIIAFFCERPRSCRFDN